MSIMQQIVTIEAQIQWIAFQSSASKRMIGVCDTLNISVEADSEDELRSLIPEAMNLLLGDLLSDNELEQFLQERGWRALNLPARRDSDVQFDVPFELVAAGARHDTERRSH
jgi:hypothetical protein